MADIDDPAGAESEAGVRDVLQRVAQRGAVGAAEMDPARIRHLFDARRSTEISGPPRSTPVHHRKWKPAVLTVAAAVVVLAVVLPLTIGSDGRNAGSNGGRTATMRLAMRLVDSSSSPFLTVGGGPQTGNLECATALVCYASDSANGASDAEVERTSDGGAHWSPTAPLPGHGTLGWPLSCPTAQSCVGVVAPPPTSSPTSTSTTSSTTSQANQPQLAFTSDGGEHWRIVTLPVPAGNSSDIIDQLSCATSTACVAHLSNEVGVQTGLFASTTDAGSNWTVTPAPTESNSSLWALQCQSNGDCIGLVPTGSAQNPSGEAIATLTSDNGGRSWTTSTSPMPLGMGVLLMSCGDATHCLLAFPANEGTSMDVATTADAGATWTTWTAPTNWPTMAVSVSCATGLDCFISASDYQQGYVNPVIEATHDGGHTWTQITLPDVDGAPLSLVFPLSCPVAAGCIGIGATPQQFNRGTPDSNPNGNRVIVSNLGTSGSS
jgi:hypothetical protein